MLLNVHCLSSFFIVCMFLHFLHCLSSSKQRDIYDETFSPLVESVLNGYNGKYDSPWRNYG